MYVRQAQKEDCPLLLKFIQDLALFEKTPELCYATLDKLESSLGFTGKQYAYAVVAVDTEVVGMAIYFTNYSTWHAGPGIYLEDLYVVHEARGKGFGTKLIQYLATEVKRIGGHRLEWSVLKWNQKAIDVYESRNVGAHQMTEWSTMRVDGQRLDELASKYDERDH